MDTRQILLAFPVVFITLVCITRTILNIQKEMIADHSDSTTWLVLLIPSGIIDGRADTFYVTDSLVQVTFNDLLKSIVHILMVETMRSLIRQVFYEETFMSITMSYIASDDQIFHAFYWKQTHKHGPKSIWYNYTYDPHHECVIRCRKLLHTVIVTYNLKTRSWHTTVRPRIFGWS